MVWLRALSGLQLLVQLCAISYWDESVWYTLPFYEEALYIWVFTRWKRGRIFLHPVIVDVEVGVVRWQALRHKWAWLLEGACSNTCITVGPLSSFRWEPPIWTPPCGLCPGLRHPVLLRSSDPDASHARRSYGQSWPRSAAPEMRRSRDRDCRGTI